MPWKIEITKPARKQLDALDQVTRDRILDFLQGRVLALTDPRQLASPLAGPEPGRWRYRVGDYRVIARFEDDRLVILVVRVAHRREVYR